ncbi:MAG: anthrone oxygenase family protein [Rhizomicrobium sp.]
MPAEILGFASVFFAGLLAGEEFVIRFGVRGPLAALDDAAHIRLRQALIRTLRILVPAIFALTFLATGAAIALGGAAFDLAFALRCAGQLALLAFMVITLAGTVPINQAVLVWNPSAPPEGWRGAIRRWEKLDTVRTLLALGAFGLLAAAGMS